MNLDTKKISDLIIATGKSHAEFAKAAQLTANTIYNVVNTGKAHPRTIKKIAQALDVPPSSLYEGTEEIKPPEVELLPKAWDVLPSKELLLMLSDMICEMSVLDPHWLPERERRKELQRGGVAIIGELLRREEERDRKTAGRTK